MPSLLARFASNAFWLARYMERAENLARLLDVNETFAQDSRGPEEWLPIVELHADTDRFFQAHEEATASAVIRFYVLDRANPSSIISAAHMARENARAQRHLISTEMWQHLNVFFGRLQALRARDLELSRLAGLCRSIKEDCQLHTGIVEGTYHRDQGWYFYQIGKYIERMDQTSRLLDINRQRLSAGAESAEGPADGSQWNALLRSLAGYHAFRRTHPRGMRAAEVVDFLVFDPGFPRSIAVCLSQAASLIGRLSVLPELHAIAMSDAALVALRSCLATADGESLIQDDLNGFVDRIQRHLIALTDDLGVAFFGRPT